MQKRKDAQIYELAFKKVDYGFWNNSLYTPLQCGAASSKDDVCDLKDNTGDNISDKNYFYSETTGTYWIWKNAPKTDYIGQCQYRRRLDFVENYNFRELFQRYKMVVNKPLLTGVSLIKHMKLCHPQIDIAAFEKIVFKLFPDYAEAFNISFNNGRVMFFSSSYVTTWELFDNYCNFLFPILNAYFNQFGFHDKKKLRKYVESKINSPLLLRQGKDISYQMLIGGFLQERLFTTWIMKNIKKEELLLTDFKFMEEDAKLKLVVR